MSFLERNLSRCPDKVKENCFNTLVRPILDYACTAWDPYIDNQIQKLELINKRAARFITGNHIRQHGQTKKNMDSLGWSPLKFRRQKLKLTMFFKINSDMIYIPRDDLVTNPLKPSRYIIPSSSVDAHLHSFFPSTIRLWNSLPLSCQTKTSLESFKNSLENLSVLSPKYDM